MCELFGLSAYRKTDIKEYLKEFFSHSDKNPHGFGLMTGDDKGLIKEPCKASDSKPLEEILEKISPQRSAVAHIRYATVGMVTAQNCHPFILKDASGREWSMIHNGTIYSVRDTIKYTYRQTGDTDSERLFLNFIDVMNSHLEKSELCERERFDIVNDFIVENAPRNKLNIIFFDGETMYVHKNLRNTLSFKRLENGIVFSTFPLDDNGWEQFPMTQVIAYKQGKEVFRGEPHKGEFIPTLEYITALDAMHI